MTELYYKERVEHNDYRSRTFGFSVTSENTDNFTAAFANYGNYWILSLGGLGTVSNIFRSE